MALRETTMAATQETTLEKLLQTKGPLPVLQVAQLASRLVKELETEAAVAPNRRAPVLRSDRVLVGPDGKVKVRPYEADGISLPVIAEFPTHASPEEIRGEDGDFRSSLYSLGCTLFQVLTGHLPFGDPRQGDDPKAILNAHLNNPAPDPRDAASRTSDGVATVVLELLRKDPEQRVQSSHELIRRLQNVVAQSARASGSTAASPKEDSAAPPRFATGGHPGSAAGKGSQRSKLRPRPGDERSVRKVASSESAGSPRPSPVEDDWDDWDDDDVPAGPPSTRRSSGTGPSARKAAGRDAAGRRTTGRKAAGPRSPGRAASERADAATRNPGRGSSRTGSSRTGAPRTGAPRTGAPRTGGSARGGRVLDGRSPTGRRAGGARMPEDDWQDEGHDDAEHVIPGRKRVYAFTIAGAAIGVVVALLVVFGMSSSSEVTEQVEKDARQKKIARHLEGQKERWRNLWANEEKEVTNFLQQQQSAIDNGGSAFVVHGRIESALDTSYHNKPRSAILAAYYADLSERVEQELGSSETTDNALWGSIQAKYKQEFDAGLFGPAIDTIREAEDDYRDDKEKMAVVDQAIEDCSNRIDALWKKDEQKIVDFAGQGDVDRALAVAEEVKRYGDPGIRGKAIAYMNRIRAEAAVQADGGSGEGGGDDFDPEGATIDKEGNGDDDDDDDLDGIDLDEELRKRKGDGDESDDDL